jgi:hypothetical protein
MTNGNEVPAGAPQVAQPPCAPPNAASGRAIVALVLGILSILCCGFFCGIPAIIIGRQEMNDIKHGLSPKEGYDLAQIGFILGIVGTALSCLGALFYALIMILGISLGALSSIQESI